MSETLNIVITGSADYGKSSIIGKLLTDTGSLPEGKLEMVQAFCARNSRPFEYDYLLETLADGPEADSSPDFARYRFKSNRRDYIIADFPGHLEFLQNVISDTPRAEAALLVVDAREGVNDSSKRYGFLLSLLGINQIIVVINKMDLINFEENQFHTICEEYGAFLQQAGLKADIFIPISALGGDNIIGASENTPWYKGKSLLEQLDGFVNETVMSRRDFRFPVQDIYKFNTRGENRQIITGTVESGKIKTGDEVIFLPSGKKSKIQTIELFGNSPKDEIGSGFSPGFTLTEELYIRPGEIMSKTNEKRPRVSARFKATLFWTGKAPMIRHKEYKIKLAAARGVVQLVDTITVTDGSESSAAVQKKQVDRYDTSECILETVKPLAFDLFSESWSTGRFVIIENYEIVGGGIITGSIKTDDSILKEHIRTRETTWDKGYITARERETRWTHRAKFIILTGNDADEKEKIAKALEKNLFYKNYYVHYLGINSLLTGLASDLGPGNLDRSEQVRRLGELAKIFTDAGMIFISTINDVDDYDLETLKLLNSPAELLVVNVGENSFDRYKVDLNLDCGTDIKEAVDSIRDFLVKKEVILEYYL